MVCYNAYSQPAMDNNCQNACASDNSFCGGGNGFSCIINLIIILVDVYKRQELLLAAKIVVCKMLNWPNWLYVKRNGGSRSALLWEVICVQKSRRLFHPDKKQLCSRNCVLR